ncbi:MAG TPA: hypothetical protein VMF65_00135 [Acidimicrobiales bacterium]|nr:hypothetical protein [Acidimicrobiales bacterium]
MSDRGVVHSTFTLERTYPVPAERGGQRGSRLARQNLLVASA